jgi:2'-hydroxyisoflavone reductase
MAITRRRFVQASLAAAAATALPGAGRAGPAAPAQGRRRILILGGTRFLGPALVEAARARGHVLTLFNRGKTNPHLFPDLEKLRGDRDGRLDALKGRTWDAVIDDSGYVPRIVKQSADLLAPGVGQYLFVSTISVYRDDIAPGSDEDAAVQELSDPKSEDVRKDYGALKAACERTVAASLPGRATVVRPTLIVGPDDPTDRFTYWPVRLDRGGEVLAPGDGEDPTQIVDVRDLAAFMIGLVEGKVTGTFNAAGPEKPATMKAMLEGCARGVGSKATLTWVPAAFLEAQQVVPWSDMPAWIPRGPDAGAMAVSNARAVAKGLRFRPVADSARDTLAWWRREPEERRRAPMRAGLPADREAAVLAGWKASQGEKKGT